MYHGGQITSYNLGRIVSPPQAGADTSPTYHPPRLFVQNAGATGLAANAATRRAQIGVGRSLQSNTGSPNTTSPVGSAGSAGTIGAQLARRMGGVRQIQLTSAITGPGGAATSTTPLAVPSTPMWMKPALFVAAGFVLGWMIFK